MPSLEADWRPILSALAITTMTVGNVTALLQTNLKRMLAYSSIAHAGYVLVGVTAVARLGDDAQASVFFYLLAYTASTVGAFGALVLAGSRGAEAVSYEDLAGLGKRHPAVALAFSLFLLSLAGVPPTAGFFGKFYIFKAAVNSHLLWLAVLMAINSIIGAYYYLRVIVLMYMREPSAEAAAAAPVGFPFTVNVVLAVTAIGTILFGLMPNPVINFILQPTLFGH
jgi:NADH-quinone oxidoreductase subunit N